MKNQRRPTTVDKARVVNIEKLIKRLNNKTVDQIFEESRLGTGLFSTFFELSGVLLRKYSFNFDVKKHEFEDYFHEALAKVIVAKKKGLINGKTPKELYFYLRRTFRRLIFCNKAGIVCNIDIEGIADSSVTKNIPGNELDAIVLCELLDKYVTGMKLFTKSEKKLWEFFKKNPDDKDTIVAKLGITPSYYDTLKFRMLKKILQANPGNFIY